MAIDWNLLQPLKGPAPEIASIQGLLGAFAENRMRQQQQAQEMAFRQQQFEAQQANIAADNARADQQLRMQQEQQRASAEMAKQKFAQEQSQTFAEKALGPAQAALRNGDLQGGRLAVQPYGGDVTQDYSQGEQASENIATRRASAADTFSPLEPVSGILGGLPQMAQAAAAMPTADESRQMAPRYQISGPAGRVLDFSPLEAEEGEKAGRTRAASVAGEALSGLRTPYSSQVLETATANALAGATPEEAVTRGMAAGQHAGDQAGMDRRAALSARLRTDTQGDTAAARAQSLLERAAMDMDRTVDWKSLQKMDQQTKLALRELATNHGLPERDAKVLAAAIFRGGVPTSGEMHELYNNLGGTADAWNRFKANVLQGRLDDKQREELESSLTAAESVVNERYGKVFKSLGKRFGPGSGYEALGPQVNAIIQSRASLAGVQVPDLYDAEETGPGAEVLGSRKKKGGQLKAAAPKARKSPEEWVKEYAK